MSATGVIAGRRRIVLDVARLYRLAIEKAEPDAIYNAVAEEGVPARESPKPSADA